MNLKAVYIHLGWFQISITNLIVILGMLILFGLALVLPFPGSKSSKDVDASKIGHGGKK